jgi:hypothetical protein
MNLLNRCDGISGIFADEAWFFAALSLHGGGNCIFVK